MDDDVADYLASLRVERGLAHNTLSAYRRDLNEYLGFVGTGPPDEPTVAAYVEYLRSRNLAPASVSRKMAAVRGLHRHLVAEGLASDDPTVLVDRPRLAMSLPKALAVDEAIALVESPDISTVAGRRDAALLEFLYGTGCRVSEAVGLDLAQLDLVERTSLVTGKGSKQRMVPLGWAAVAAIERWLPDRLDLAKADHDAVFVNLRGGRLSRQGAFLVVKAAASRAGVAPERISPHVLRHSAATHMIEGGADLRSVQEMLGHANVTTTQVYTRVSPQHLLEVFVQAHPRSR
ncbi:MAG: tyrosine recombinase [Acidimicrobiia bacterium]